MAVRQLRYCTHCGMPLAPRGSGPINFCRHCGQGLRRDAGLDAPAPIRSASGSALAPRGFASPRPALFLVADLPHNAGHLRRMGAGVVDLVAAGLCAMAVGGVGIAVAFIVAGHHTPAAGPVGWVAGAAVLLAYQPTFWARIGRTPGMLIFGIRVARPDGSRIGPVRAAVRELAMVASALPLGLGFLLAARDPRGQAWHDRISGTVVVTARSPQRRPQPRPS